MVTKPSLSIVLAITGQYQWVEGEIAETFKHLEHSKELPIEVILVCDGMKWLTTPLLQTFQFRFGQGCKLLAESETHLPAVLFNGGARSAEADHLLMIWAGCEPDIREVLAAINARKSSPDLCGWLDPRLLDKMGTAIDVVMHSWNHLFQCHNLFRLSNVIVKKASFLKLGGFDPNHNVQRYFDWEFWLRCVRAGQELKGEIGGIGKERWNWETYPIENDYRIPRFVARNYCLNNCRSLQEDDKAEIVLRNSKIEESYPQKDSIARSFDSLDNLESIRKAMIKVAVISGLYDYVHSQLCFYNYFDSVRVSESYAYVSLLDVLVEPEKDLQSLDLVIISRGRVENIYRVLDYCKKHLIPTLYMIDDNWFWVGKDWSEHYSNLFSPGSVAYQVFITSLAECSAVLVYNQLLAEDVRPFAKRVIQLPVNVQQEAFCKPLQNPKLQQLVAGLKAWKSQTNGVIIGYVGSVRYIDVAFQALAKVARRYSRVVRVLLFGHLLPSQLEFFSGLDVVTIPYVSYQEYASTLNSLRPDILVAPLDASRTSMSKAPNKYLEYSIVRAAGIYSAVYPYTEVVKAGATGLLVNNEANAWEQALIQLIEDVELRQRIALAAEADVLTHHETGVVAPIFVQTLASIVSPKQSGAGGSRV